mmetsp:Transcript_58451/g.155526  ORF Transcript_58451/g.155526 Transcript_58451/m.155526 type:complete len:210 (-) Transcript_58451:103-732(-)
MFVSLSNMSRVSSSSPCIRRSWSVRVLSIASLTKIAFITFNTASTVITTKIMNTNAYPHDTSRRMLNTSHQSMPPATAMNNVIIVMNRVPKKTFISSTSGSPGLASDTYCDVALRNTTENKNVTIKSTKTAQNSIMLQLMMATVIRRSFRTRCVKRIRRSIRSDLEILMTRRARKKLGLNPRPAKNISAIDKATRQQSNRFHRHSGPTK